MKFRRREGVDEAPMENQTVLYIPTSKAFCVLNETAAFLWERLAKEATADELVQAMVEAFDGVDSATAGQDVRVALDELNDLDLLAQAP